ncbi:MAG: hypothetical protein SGJ16_10430, partial [Nitrospirota bacterium]|nr:hypothetical protein [Nitrospirota bacterium]
SHALAPLLAMRYMAWVEQDYHLSTCPNFRHHLSLDRYSLTLSATGCNLTNTLFSFPIKVLLAFVSSCTITRFWL